MWFLLIIFVSCLHTRESFKTHEKFLYKTFTTLASNKDSDFDTLTSKLLNSDSSSIKNDGNDYLSDLDNLKDSVIGKIKVISDELSSIPERIQHSDLSNIKDSIVPNIEYLSKSFPKSLPAPPQLPDLSLDLTNIKNSVFQTMTDISTTQPPQISDIKSFLEEIKFSDIIPIFYEILNSLSHTAEIVAADVRTLPLALVIVFFMVVGGYGQNDSLIKSPYTPGSAVYNVTLSNNFYSSRPLFVLRRLLKLGQITSSFNFKLFLDWRLGTLEKNEPHRAKEALNLATQLGPTFIKLGQALSIRTDLIPKAYALELRQLQDAIPPFDTKIATKVIIICLKCI